MGYACPVCGDPQADAGHLANHLAFTAMTGGADHEAWLDETVGDWGQLGEAELGELVADHAEQREFPQVFEESGVEDHDKGHDHSMPPGADRQPDRDISEADAAVLEEARELTREMREEAGDGDGTGGEDEGEGESESESEAEDENEDETE